MAVQFATVPAWGSWENQGANVAAADLDGDGKPELIVLRVDHPTPGPNAGFYRVGRGLAADSTVNAWGPWIAVPNWSSNANQGAGVAVARFPGEAPGLVVFQIEHRTPGPNRGLYRVGRKLDAQGRVQDGWSTWVKIDGWGSWEDQGGGFALASFPGGGRPRAVVLHVDNPPGLNEGRYAVVELKLDLDSAPAEGMWR